MSPAGSTNPLPEERLLKLIRAKVAPASASAGGQTSAAPASAAARASRPSWFPIALAGLSLVLVVQLGMLLQQLLAPAPTVSALPAPDSAPAGAPVVGGSDDPLLEVPLLSQSAPQPLFGSLIATTASAGASGSAHSQGPSQSAQDLSARLSLMGIMGGEPPQVIIQDTKTQKTFFVSPGQAVVDGATLKSVLENRVILELRGEEIELSL